MKTRGISKIKKLLVLPLTLTLSLAAPTTAFADDSSDNAKTEKFKIIEVKESETVQDVDSITIDGVTYSKEQGAQVHTIVFDLEKVPDNGYETRDYWPYHNYKWTRGTSYVQNEEIGYLHYRGRALANGNVFQGKRVIQASITYKRGGEVLKKAVSNATFQGNRWVSGGLKTITVTDSLNPFASETKVYYNFVTIDPGLVG